ncbi:MAG: MATE family efflux transporter [Selenomonadaceae bacterium]|nr:MATE family efflux transporter [Selenomonadaceae bacterium]
MAVKKLTEGDPQKLILAFTIPLILGNVFQQLYAFVDTFMVGRFLGVKALAAVGSTGALMFLVWGFIGGFTTGLSICAGQRFGARDRSGVRKSAATSVWICVALTLVVSIVGYVTCRDLLIFMETPAEILEGAYDFISVVYVGSFAFIFLQLQTNLMRALGDSKTPTYILAISLTLNIIFEPIAIIVLDGGIFGAALAIVVAQTIGNLLAAFYIHKKISVLHTRYVDWKIDWKVMWEHLKLALPMGFQLSIIAVGAVILQIALNNLGPIAIAAYAAAQKVESVAAMPMMSFGIAMAAYTAQNYGAKKFDRIHDGIVACVKMSVSFAIIVGITLIFFGHYLIELFVGEGFQAAEVVESGKIYLLTNGASLWLLSLMFIFRNVLQGLGKAMAPTVTGVIELFMRAAAAILLIPLFGFTGACLANPLAWIGAVIPLLIAYHYVKRKLRML